MLNQMTLQPIRVYKDTKDVFINKQYIDLTAVSNPKKISIRKKHTAQNWGKGIMATPWGKAMNASPGPGQ